MTAPRDDDPACETPQTPCAAPGSALQASLPGVLETLDSLRQRGAERWNPVRMRYLSVMAQRTQHTTGALHDVLLGKLRRAVNDCAQQFEQSNQATEKACAPWLQQHPEQVPTLHRLLKAGDHLAAQRLMAGYPYNRTENRHRLWESVHAALNGPQSGTQNTPPTAALHKPAPAAENPTPRTRPLRGTMRPPELKSVRRFRETWARISAQHRVAQAVERRHDHAGPLNSHRLVLDSLELMRTLSPEYLQRFVTQMDTLLWLEQALQPAHAPAAVSVGTTRHRSPPRKKK